LLEVSQQTLESFAASGLGYLSLDRPTGTLSGLEARASMPQRSIAEHHSRFKTPPVDS
jgi:excinuclease UvrABC ATPase subunit